MKKTITLILILVVSMVIILGSQVMAVDLNMADEETSSSNTSTSTNSTNSTKNTTNTSTNTIKNEEKELSIPYPHKKQNNIRKLNYYPYYYYNPYYGQYFVYYYPSLSKYPGNQIPKVKKSKNKYQK